MFGKRATLVIMEQGWGVPHNPRLPLVSIYRGGSHTTPGLLILKESLFGVFSFLCFVIFHMRGRGSPLVSRQVELFAVFCRNLLDVREPQPK